MTTMTTRVLRAALATAFLTTGAASLQAAPTGPARDAIEVRVVNNHNSAVQVYAQDIFGRLHSLGWVNRSDAKVLTVPTKMTELGAVQIQVFPDEPIWSPRSAPDGVRTMPLNLKTGDTVDFWVETELTDSYLQIVRS